MQFRILGSMEVLDGTRRVDLPAGRSRALLALLVLHTGEAVSAERLIDELWGEDSPVTARTVVHVHVSRLRRELEPSRERGQPSALLQTVGSGYRLAVEPDQVDADHFKRLLDQSRGATPEVRSAILAEALGLWRGPPLADFTYEPFAQRAITALSELRLVAIEDRMEAELALGRSGELVAELGELTGAHPFRERLRGLLMVALYRAGRQADALQAYRTHARRWSRGWGSSRVQRCGASSKRSSGKIGRWSCDPAPARRYLVSRSRVVGCLASAGQSRSPSWTWVPAPPSLGWIPRRSGGSSPAPRPSPAGCSAGTARRWSVTSATCWSGSSDSPSRTRTTRCAPSVRRSSCARPSRR